MKQNNGVHRNKTMVYIENNCQFYNIDRFYTQLRINCSNCCTNEGNFGVFNRFMIFYGRDILGMLVSFFSFIASIDSNKSVYGRGNN